MDKDQIINKLRVLVNLLPLMGSSQQEFAIGKANKMLDEYFAGDGKFIATDIVGIDLRSSIMVPL